MKKLISTLVIGLLIVPITVQAASFPDVTDSTNYRDSILWMADNGVIQGNPDGTFLPDKCVNRAEMLKILFLMNDVTISTEGTVPFPDVEEDDWFHPYVLTAYNRNTVQGYPDGSFQPGKCVKRVEALKMAVLEFNDGIVPSPSAEPPATNYYEQDWYYEYLNYASANNQIGLEHVTYVDEARYNYKQGGEMTRKEAAEMLYRMKAVQDAGHSSYVEGLVPAGLPILYLAVGSEGEYSLVNLSTGETQDFIPNGYEVRGQHDYDPLPEFLILTDGSNLAAFNVDDESLNEVFESEELLLASNEIAGVYPSITEKDNFFIVISEIDPDAEAGLGGPPIIDKRSYFFDATNDTLTESDNIELEGCAKYDSKNQRFFSWICAEGAGSSLPLSTMDLEGNELQEVISPTEFGLEAGNVGSIAVEYYDGTFFAQSKGSVDKNKIITLDPEPVNPQKEIYTISSEVMTEMEGKSYPYSTALAESKGTFVIGGSQYITLLRYSDNQITESKVIPEQNVYANFIFPYKDTLYFPSGNAVRKVNLDTWEVSKGVPSPSRQVITLIKK